MANRDDRKPALNPLPDREDRTRGSGGGLASLGIQFAGAIVLFVLIGQWVDRRYATDPWGILGGALIGFSAGLYSVFRAARSAELRDAASRKGPPADGGST
jgi:F0F1-type ATP synthase assembly protein I